MDMGLVDSILKYNSWFKYAEEGNLNKIEKWINKSKIWIDFPDQNGNPALYYAIKNGDLHVIQFLIGEGAHFYKNDEKGTPWSIAVGQVKIYLETLDPQPKIETIEELITQQVLKLSSIEHKEVVKFIFSLPEKYQKIFFKDYVPDLVFYDSDKVLDLLNRIEDEEFKVEIQMQAIYTALSCGDIKLAKSVKEAIPEKYSTYPHVEIRAFEICFKILENEDLRKIFYPNEEFSFEQVVSDGLKNLGLLYSKVFEENGEKITLDMIKTNSFKKALEYADSLENPREKAFVRRGLSCCGLEGLLFLAKELGEKAAGNYFEKKNDEYLDILEEAVKEKNFELIKSYFPDKK